MFAELWTKTYSLSVEGKNELERLARPRTVPHRETQRAAIVLGYHAGESITSIGLRLGVTRLSVAKWVAKGSMAALSPLAAMLKLRLYVWGFD
jgi:hypothetical protein